MAVLLDAVVVPVMILPALLLLLGRASWWPSRGAGRTGRSAPVDRELAKVG